MKFNLIENISIATATIALGIMAGFFWTYTFNVNLAMLNVDGKTYAEVQSLFNENVRHFMFFAFFFGAGAISFLAAAINYRHIGHISFWLISIAALIYILGIIVFTAKVNLPLNYYTESWNPSDLPVDWEMVRDSWNQANTIRVGTSFTAFVLGVCALCVRCSTK
ncbi:Putative uncharacterized protein [Moritella viscosa]|uniref:Uncharacterized protein n=1 Tax=Moritella viscosa TaxID=80854 RepID=A0A090IC19_9GAMM|nr:DUF1772 domain-containing protein [Moritella viscosa]CED59715.1 membrane protein [Moritella viscosa]SGY89719.1 Putative uncharacterized protein [Moritella viscosa]SGY91981.1 Putative uncharacterized protein [Moritella viscosa]SHO02052.1 Putative uncharacterized protein [Moritella viscosa]SHO02221.1 Putative uncharacterized protein [Moritella viscosa]